MQQWWAGRMQSCWAEPMQHWWAVLMWHRWWAERMQRWWAGLTQQWWAGKLRRWWVERTYRCWAGLTRQRSARWKVTCWGRVGRHPRRPTCRWRRTSSGYWRSTSGRCRRMRLRASPRSCRPPAATCSTTRRSASRPSCSRWRTTRSARLAWQPPSLLLPSLSPPPGQSTWSDRGAAVRRCGSCRVRWRRRHTRWVRGAVLAPDRASPRPSLDKAAAPPCRAVCNASPKRPTAEPIAPCNFFFESLEVYCTLCTDVTHNITLYIQARFAPVLSSYSYRAPV